MSAAINQSDLDFWSAVRELRRDLMLVGLRRNLNETTRLHVATVAVVHEICTFVTPGDRGAALEVVITELRAELARNTAASTKRPEHA